MLFTFRANWLAVLGGGRARTGRPLHLKGRRSGSPPKEGRGKESRFRAAAAETKGEKTKRTSSPCPTARREELLKFIDKTGRARPTHLGSREDMMDFLKSLRQAIVAAADKILAADAQGKTRIKAIEAKFEARPAGPTRVRRCKTT